MNVRAALCSIASLALLLGASPRTTRGDEPKPAAPPVTPPAAPAPAPAARVPTVNVSPGPGGMVTVQRATARIGTKPEDFVKLTKSRKEVMLVLSYETPQHEVELPGYWIDACEVTNAQYLVFLDQTAKTKVQTGADNTLGALAKRLLSKAGDPTADRDDVYWRQLFWLNEEGIRKAKPEMKDAAVDAFKEASLPTDLEMVVYTRRLPDHWKKGAPPDELRDHPVRFVSYLDAEAYAEWAGKHLPTEQEWEYAARGPDGWTLPWGEEWKDAFDAATSKRIVEDRLNWADLGKVDKSSEPTTVASEEMPGGRSWCGCFHMLGNVAEWTSSWFEAYPEWIDPAPDANPFAAYQGDYVKVIRGGCALDRERLVLRSSARNFQGAGSINPPKPENRFAFVGFRCSAYVAPGLDRFDPVAQRMSEKKRIAKADLDQSRLVGAAATFWSPPGAVVKDHVHVTGRSSSVFFAPKVVLYDMAERALAKSPGDVLDRTQDDTPLLIGVYHTDIGIEKANVIDSSAPVAEKPQGGRRHKGGKGATKPAVKPGKIDAGSYLIGLWFGEVVLLRPNLDVMGFLGKPSAVAKNLKKDEKPPASAIDVDADADLVKVTTWLRLGGRDTQPTEGITLTFSVTTVSGALSSAGSWR
jgi:formylglycine-generating enzyme required for sulfatase activity